MGREVGSRAPGLGGVTSLLTTAGQSLGPSPAARVTTGPTSPHHGGDPRGKDGRVGCVSAARSDLLPGCCFDLVSDGQLFRRGMAWESVEP